VKSPKLFLVTVATAVTFATLVASASAGRLSVSERSWAASWARISFVGGIGTVECEAALSHELHARTLTKTRGSLIGYMAAVEIERCRTGAATLLRETLPWHVQYDSFGGTLPSIGSIRTLIIGFSMRIREPTFGMVCLARSTAAEPVIETYNLTANVITSHSLGGTIRCGSVDGTLSGTSLGLSGRVTVTLI